LEKKKRRQKEWSEQWPFRLPGTNQKENTRVKKIKRKGKGTRKCETRGRRKKRTR